MLRWTRCRFLHAVRLISNFLLIIALTIEILWSIVVRKVHIVQSFTQVSLFFRPDLATATTAAEIRISRNFEVVRVGEVFRFQILNDRLGSTNHFRNTCSNEYERSFHDNHTKGLKISERLANTKFKQTLKVSQMAKNRQKLLTDSLLQITQRISLVRS